MNKASGGDGSPVALFQILKDDDVKVLHSICQKNWKTKQWPQEWKRSVFFFFFLMFLYFILFYFILKGQFSFQSQRKAMPKNAQTTAQLHSSHMLAE